MSATTPEACPFCGAARKKGVGFVWFECGTMTSLYNRGDQVLRCADAERERLTRERDEASARVATAIAERDSARARADQVWKLREEFVSLIGTDDIATGVEAVKALRERIKRLEEVLSSAHGGEPLVLLDELDAARERVKRLEKAGERLRFYFRIAVGPDATGWETPHGVDIGRRIEAAFAGWTKAKETKP